jgi:hypothetical protein
MMSNLPGIWCKRCLRKRTTSSPLKARSCSNYVELAFEGDGAHRREVISAEMLLEDGRLSHRSVSANHRRKQVEARLIGKHYGSALLQRPLFLSEKATSFLSSVLWPPRPSDSPGAAASADSLSQRFEQTTHMSGVVTDPKLFADHYSHPLARPYLSPKTMGLGSLCQELGQSSALILAEAGCRSRSGLAL